MREALAAHDAIFREIVPHHHGVIFKTVGDAICAAFERPDDALRAAVESQRRLTAHAWPEDIGSIRVRMGIHTGMAQERDDDYFGPAVNRVARFMSIAHGGQILVSGSTRELLRHLDIDISLRELGEHRLKDLKEPEPAFQVLADGLVTEFPSLTSVEARPNNLPTPISNFVGRIREMAEVSSALGAHRLIAVVGPGGVGKTRLAIELARAMLPTFRDGAWFVELAGISDSALVAQTVADALGIREDPNVSVSEQLLHSLAHKQLLVVLDNSEHLLSDVATLALRLLQACPGVRVVVTSREPLHLDGERIVRLLPLELDGDPSSGMQSEGVRLFFDRAQAVRPDLISDDGHARQVARICERLEGIPLAIELAAARAATLSLAQIEERLADRFAILISHDPTRSERQRTLRATIDWSFRLLEPAERRFARDVAIFTGGFTLEAAEAVCADPVRAVDLLESLVDKSLLSVQRAGARHRYTFFDTVQRYLIAEVPAGDSDPLPARHFSYCTALAGRQGERSTAEQHGDWIELIGYEINNMRSALEWALPLRPNDAGRLVADLCRYWQIRGHLKEGSAWLGRVLSSAGLESGVRGALLRRSATFAAIRNDFRTARTLCAEATTAFEIAGDRGGVAEAMFTLAIIDQSTGDIPAATDHYLAALSGFRAMDNVDAQLRAVFNLALIAQSNDDLGWAEALLEQSAELEPRSTDVHLGADLTRLRGYLDLRRGRLPEAAVSYERSLAVKRAIGSRFDSAEILNDLATVYFRNGDVDRALTAASESMRIALELDAPLLIIVGFEAFAEIALARGRHADAAQCLAFAGELRDRHDYRHAGDRDMPWIAGELERLSWEKTPGDFPPDDWRNAAEKLSRWEA
jgi:predicted ATPase